MKFSIVIANYNYERYVGQAIDSALAIDWPDVEVIVVDDGSTDGSREVIAAYGNRIVTLMQVNAGQLAATNAGYEKATGDWVIFLDSDDLLMPSVAREVIAAATPRTSKLQFKMARMNGDGQLTGSRFPVYTPFPTPEKTYDWATRFAAYPCPPGSGNVFAKSFLDKLFPLTDACGEAPDSAMVTAAPFFGDVVTIDKPLVHYRIHGNNDSNLFARPGLFGREVARAHAKFVYAQEIARTQGLTMKDSVFRRNLHAIQHRIPSLKLDPALHPLPWDSPFQVLKDMLISTLQFEAMAPKRRLVLCAWGALTLLAPKSLAKKLIRLRFNH